MAFNASGTNYSGFLDQRRLADNQLTQAQDAKGRADKQSRIKESGKRSGVQKLLSAAARGAAAYYTGGMSETMGGGAMIDGAMLGTDSQGNAVRNEYGDLVGAATQIGGAMANKSGSEAALKLARSDARNEKMMQDLTPEARFEIRMAQGKRNDKNDAAFAAHKEGGFLNAFSKPEIDSSSIETGSYKTKLDESLAEMAADQKKIADKKEEERRIAAENAAQMRSGPYNNTGQGV
mgnify:FL=1